jgi:transcriptional regulator with XRE-family HTH domain
MSMAEKIQRARKKRRWSQEELARRAKLSQSAVSRLESGELDNPTADVVRNLCLALDMSSDYLIDLYKEVEKKMAEAR